MFDQYLVRYITEYLKLCNYCRRYDFTNNKSFCCICSKFYCSSCNFHLKSIYGFSKSKYCYDCYNYYYNI